MKKPSKTVTQNGMSKSQPGTCVSVTFGGRFGVQLSVKRYYPNLRNSFGGLGVFKSMDSDGKVFLNSDDAWEFAYDHGYIREYFSTPSARAARKANVARQLRRNV